MNDQNKLNKGYMFQNKKKSQAKQPDLSGKVNWKGEEIQIAAWERTNEHGEKFLSLSLSEKFVKPEGNTGNNTGNNTGSNTGGNTGHNHNSGNYAQNNNSGQQYSAKPKTTADLPDNGLDDLNSLFDDN